MIEVRTLNLKLRLERNFSSNNEGEVNYLIVLMGESPFDVSKSFSEKISTDNEQKPFTTLEDVVHYVNQTAIYWQGQLQEFPQLHITGVQELADLWIAFANSLNSFYSNINNISSPAIESI